MKILVVGGTGTLGTEFVRQEYGISDIVVISRDELKQKELKAKFKDIETHVCDIRDAESVDEIFVAHKFSKVFHFAAMKHVDVCESQPLEAVKTNVLGTKNVINAAKRHGVEEFVFSSTDKAVNPINVYGMTKAIAEAYIVQFELGQIYRWGNIIGSRGSVIPKMVKTILAESTAYITHPDMTRFWLRIEDAVEFLRGKRNGEMTFDRSRSYSRILSCRSASVIEIARAVADILGKTVEIKYTGVCKGEKLHEQMSDFVYSNTCEMYSRDELIDLLSPVVIEYRKKIGGYV